MKLILVAEGETASVNIAKILLDKHPELERYIIRIPGSVLDIDKHYTELKKRRCDLLIVSSDHASKSGIPMLTCHAPGNWTANDLGGDRKTLSIAPALYLREGILELKRQKEKLGLKKYVVGLEVTHHSPTIDLPVIFVEVGSTKKEWSDMKACEAAAETIYRLFTKTPTNVSTYVGFGGGHYAPVFTRRVLEDNVAFGHICPKYQLDMVSEEVVIESLRYTKPLPKAAVIEWKGCSATQRQKLIDIFEQNGVTWIKDKELK